MTAPRYQPVQPFDPEDPQEHARRIIARTARLLEHATNSANLSDDERHWFVAPPLMPDADEARSRAISAVKRVAITPPRICKNGGCGALVYRVLTRAGTAWVVNPDGEFHAATCRGKRE